MNYTKNKKVIGLENAKIFKIKAGTFANPKRKILGTGFVNVSTYPTKVELDLDILGDYAYEYLPQIAYNIGIPQEKLKELLNNYNSENIKERNYLIQSLQNKEEAILRKINNLGGIDSLDKNDTMITYLNNTRDRISRLSANGSFKSAKTPILLRISIPFWRLHENCYCGDLYVSKEDFLKGVLIFNKSFGKFCINVLPEHRFLLDDYYNRFVQMLKQIDMDDRAFYFACPELGNRATNIGHFCTVCLKNKKRAKQRLILKAIASCKNKIKKTKFSNFKLCSLKIKTIKKIITEKGN